jgi:hypothetical protein
VVGGNVIVSDPNGGCPRRLLPLRDANQNVIGGFLMVQANGKDSVVVITPNPQVIIPGLSVPANQAFTGIMLSAGASGTQYTLLPPAVANLFLQTDGNGNLILAGLPSGTVPDPLTLGTINVNTLLNLVGSATFAGAVSMSGLSVGAALSFLGLNAEKGLVLAPPVVNAKALYFEAPSLTANNNLNQPIKNTSGLTPGPNEGLVSGMPAIIVNRIYDPAGLVLASGSTSLTIQNPGSYQIDWQGTFHSINTVDVYYSLNLNITGGVFAGIVSFGDGPVTVLLGGSQYDPQSGTVHGSYFSPNFGGGEVLSLIASVSASGASPKAPDLLGTMKLTNVQILITRIA